MFESQNVETFLQDTYCEADGEKRIVKMRCYVNPVSRELCDEVDKEITRTLFHLVGKEWMPRPLLQRAQFDLGTLPPYALNFCRDPQHGNHHVHIPTVTISKIEAGKVTPESNDFALMFTIAFEKHDPKIVNDLADLLHEKFFLSFTELQPSLFENEKPVMGLVCRLCDAPNPEFATQDDKFAYCAKCSINAQEGEKLHRIRDAAAAEATAHAIDEEGRKEGEENGPPRVDPLLDEGINERNRAIRRKRT